MKKIEMDIECPDCNGTGLYIDLVEEDGIAFVCNSCNGTGKYHYVFRYKLFQGIQKREDISCVYKSGYEYALLVEKIGSKKGGVNYNDFLKGKVPEHLKKLVCPFSVEQSTCEKIKGFYEECERLNGGDFYLIYECKNQKNKADCWKRFDRGKENEY